MTQEELLSMQEAAQTLGISMPTLYAIMERKELEPAEERQHGRQRRRFFRRSDVEALKRQRVGEIV